MSTAKKRVGFAICVDAGALDDLQVWKIYRTLPDVKAAGAGCLRVVDDSGDNYLYRAERFVAVSFPKNVRARLLRAIREPA